MTDFGADDSFAKASAKMKEHYGIIIPVSAMRTITEKHAKIIQTIPLKTEIPLVDGKDCIIAETDGCMIPIVECNNTGSKNNQDSRKNRKTYWKEGRLCLAYSQESTTPFFSATMGKPDETGDHLLNSAVNVGLGITSNVHCVGDGASWIANQVSRVFNNQGGYLIDFYHLCEYLSPASAKCNTEKSMYKKHKEMIKADNITEVIDQLSPHVENEEIPDEKAPVRKCIRYINNRPGQFDYQNAMESNLPIGSGEIESAHRYVIQARLKLTGAWWKRNIANDMLALRTLRANNMWNEYWADDFMSEAA